MLSFEPIDENNISTQEHMIAADSKIQEMIQDTSCTQNSECESIAYGAKACGDPQTYLVYSTQNVDVAQLQPLVNQYNAYAEQYNEENSIVSDCSYVTPSELECQGHCYAVSTAASSSDSI